MNGKLIFGIVLLALIALTGMVSAATTGTADLSASVNIPTQSLTLTITGSQAAWSMTGVGGYTSPTPRPQISVTSVGYPNGYHVTMADKQTPPPSVAIPIAPPGYFSMYNAQSNSFSATHLKNSLVASLPCTSNLPITGSDQTCFSSTADFGPSDLKFNQMIDATDQNGNYRIFVTFTAIPN